MEGSIDFINIFLRYNLLIKLGVQLNFHSGAKFN